MSGNNIYTPEGFQDILFEECRVKRDMESKLRHVFAARGYRELETPALEFADVFCKDGQTQTYKEMFQMIDKSGMALALRPDITACIARVAATKLKEKHWPVKCAYIGNLFRFHEAGLGKLREFTQAGVEIIGVPNPEADAEVIATAIDCSFAAGLQTFQIELGQVGFFKGIMEQAQLSVNEAEEIRRLIDSKDLIGLERTLESSKMCGDVKDLILKMPGWFGSTDVIVHAKKVISNEKAGKALENLEQIVAILNDYGYAQYITVDLGAVQNLEYYTGLIFRGFTYGIGYSYLGGGRYDNLLGQFGAAAPATGFALGINMLMHVIYRQKIETVAPSVRILVSYMPQYRAKAFALAKSLRETGLHVEMDISHIGDETAQIQHAKNENIAHVLFVEKEDSCRIWKAQDEKTHVCKWDEVENILNEA